MRHDQRQRVLVRRPDMNEVDVDLVDLVVNLGYVLSFASALRESYSEAQ